jgi:hypothetical protein
MKQWEVVILVLILLTAESYFLTSTKLVEVDNLSVEINASVDTE